MKKFKFPLLLMAIAVAIAGVFAFTFPAKPAKKQVVETYFKLVTDGDPLVRTDWEPATGDICPSAHTNMVCRILAVDDSGVPDQTSFDDILYNSEDFGKAYGKVSYVPVP